MDKNSTLREKQGIKHHLKVHPEISGVMDYGQG